MTMDNAEQNTSLQSTESAPKRTLNGGGRPSAGAMALAERIFDYGISVNWGQGKAMMSQLEMAEIIDRESGLSELLAACGLAMKLYKEHREVCSSRSCPENKTYRKLKAAILKAEPQPSKR